MFHASIHGWLLLRVSVLTFAPVTPRPPFPHSTPMPQRAFGQQRMEALIAQTDREKEDLARRKEAEAKQIREEAEQAVSCLQSTSSTVLAC